MIFAGLANMLAWMGLVLHVVSFYCVAANNDPQEQSLLGVNALMAIFWLLAVKALAG